MPTEISECFLKHSMNVFTSFLYRSVIVFSWISFQSRVLLIRVYNGSHEVWCNSTLKTRPSNTSLLAEVVLLLPLPPQPPEVYILWRKSDPFFLHSHPCTACCWPAQLPPSLPPYIGVHFILQVQIRLLSNIHRARTHGSVSQCSWGMYKQNSYWAVIIRGKIRAGFGWP